jgi:hypothetical protein
VKKPNNLGTIIKAPPGTPRGPQANTLRVTVVTPGVQEVKLLLNRSKEGHPEAAALRSTEENRRRFLSTGKSKDPKRKWEARQGELDCRSLRGLLGTGFVSKGEEPTQQLSFGVALTYSWKAQPG